MRAPTFWSLLASFAVGCLVHSTARAATFTVINTNQAGAGSLQQAIFDANTNAGADFITFNIGSAGLTIAPTNPLPTITESVVIDGATQPGFAGSPIIEINGTSAGAGGVDGLKVSTSNCVIRALTINRFTGDGVEITNGANNIIEGCYIGLSRNGAADQGNTQNGILITNSANNIIGGLFSTNRNFIAGNNANGVHLGGLSSTNNAILGNVIGLGVTNNALGNSADGIHVNSPSPALVATLPARATSFPAAATMASRLPLTPLIPSLKEIGSGLA